MNILKKINYIIILFYLIYLIYFWGLGIGDWGLGGGGVGRSPNPPTPTPTPPTPQSPIPNPQSPKYFNYEQFIIINKKLIKIIINNRDYILNL